MAFTVSNDVATQEAARFEQSEFAYSPAAIKHILTAAHVEARHRRAQFVGIDAYVL